MTLQSHNEDIQLVVEKLNLISLWGDILSENDTAKFFLPEIFSDAHNSANFAGMGLYKYSNMCLRSELESVLRLIFFSTHPVEFDWWKHNKNQTHLGKKHVWGDDYSYFNCLTNIATFNSTSRVNIVNEIKGTYRILSSYVHTSSSTFQTKSGIAPRYELGKFRAWLKTFIEIQEYLHILFILSFYESFCEASKSDKDSVASKGINKEPHKRAIEEQFYKTGQ